jgi:hypothetical protein
MAAAALARARRRDRPMSNVTPLKPAARKRLRLEVQAWARQFGFTPQISFDDPENIVIFIGLCLENFPEKFTHAHGSEIFSWCKEAAPWSAAGITFDGTTDGPEAA